MAGPSSSSGSRVLCLTLHQGACGHAVLDGFGAAPGSVFSTRYLTRGARSKFAALRLLLRRSLRRYRPDCVVLGLPDTRKFHDADLGREADRFARAAGLPIVVHWLREGRLLITGRTHLGVERLARLLTEGFVPELKDDIPALHRNPWYRRPAWDALALALVELTHRRPRVAAALATQAARFPSFWEAVASYDRELHPLPI